MPVPISLVCRADGKHGTYICGRDRMPCATGLTMPGAVGVGAGHVSHRCTLNDECGIRRIYIRVMMIDTELIDFAGSYMACSRLLLVL